MSRQVHDLASSQPEIRPMMDGIAGALTALKSAKDVAEAMVGLRDAQAFQTKLLEFQAKLIDANNAAFAAQGERSMLLETVRELEAKVRQLEAWILRRSATT
jgi:hypothetical protein